MSTDYSESSSVVADSPAHKHCEDLIDFVVASPSSYHAAGEVVRRMVAAGATYVTEADPWPAAAGTYVMQRGGAAVAWIVPPELADDPATWGFSIVGSHTDSPGFRLKPNPVVTSAGYAQAACEVYGGALLGAWTDREIEFAGRVVDVDGAEHLVRTGPIARIPQLAIHLNRAVNEEGLKLHRQRHTVPIIGLLPESGSAAKTSIHQAIAAAAGMEVERIVAWDLISCDTQRPRTFGLNNEFLACGRLDNLLSVHASLVAFENMLATGTPPATNTIPVLVAFDHEEVGSASTTGAAGPLLADVLTRIATAAGATGDMTQRMYRRSVCLSVDGGHAVHPNYVEEHEPGHHPKLDGGPVLKINANQRYATNAVGQALVERVAKQASERIGETIPVQYFVSANHKPCGSTIGPITATRLGIETIDLGAAMLSMHSPRELCGVKDPWWMMELITSFWTTTTMGSHT
ncbi:M18 family aminopeptidase [Corynebacterium sp. H78]|uniref:M18 family aminopeptidase n=1 Tax=Corynebacterium sp. H78 TaxID=3133417 RepID=UPI0030AC0166